MIETLVSVVSLIVSVAATLIAKSSLGQTRLAVKEQKQANEQAQTDWAQRKWFDLYLKADQAYDALEHYQTLYQSSNPATMSEQKRADRDAVIHLFREANAMAIVFPKNDATDALFATTDFRNPIDMLSTERLKTIANALELLRQRALVNKSVLKVLTDG